MKPLAFEPVFRLSESLVVAISVLNVDDGGAAEIIRLLINILVSGRLVNQPRDVDERNRAVNLERNFILLVARHVQSAGHFTFLLVSVIQVKWLILNDG